MTEQTPDLAARDRELTAARVEVARLLGELGIGREDEYSRAVAERDRLRAELSQVKAALAQKTLERPGIPDDPQVIADRIARLRAENDESTKQQAVELDRLRAENELVREIVRVEHLDNTRLRHARDRLLAECDSNEMLLMMDNTDPDEAVIKTTEVRRALSDSPAPTEDGAK